MLLNVTKRPPPPKKKKTPQIDPTLEQIESLYEQAVYMLNPYSQIHIKFIS